MKKNAFLLSVCTAIIITCSVAVSAQQKNVPLNNNEVSTKRGDLSNPLPDPGKRDTIHGAEDVSVVFGAGESSVIGGRIVRWPADHATPFDPKPIYELGDPPSADGKTTAVVGGYAYPGHLLIGSDYSKNAVVGIYDNDGLAAGAVSGIRLYGVSGNTGSPTSSVPICPPIDIDTGEPFEGEKSLGWWQYGDGTPGGNAGTLAAYNAGKYTENGVTVNGYEYYTRTNASGAPIPNAPGQCISNTVADSIKVQGSSAYRWWILGSQVTADDTIKPRNMTTLEDVPARFPDAEVYSSYIGGSATGVHYQLENPSSPGNYINFLISVGGTAGPLVGPALIEQTYQYMHITTGNPTYLYNGGTTPYYAAGILKPYFNTTIGKYVVPIWNHAIMTDLDRVYNGIKDQTSFTFDVIEGASLYTSTRNDGESTDNGESLLFKIPGQFDPLAGSSATKIPIKDFQDKLDKDAHYIRPTTVLVTGLNELEEIVIGDVEWYAAFLASTKIGDEYVGPFWTKQTHCAHLSGWAAYKRDLVDFDTIRYDTGHPDFDPNDPLATPIDGTYPSGRYVDAAVRILDNADVCVVGNVLDNTTETATTSGLDDGKYSYEQAGDEEKTNALLVLPGYNSDPDLRSNFRLKIGGNADMRHFQDDNFYNFTATSNPLEDGMLYRNAQSSGGTESPGEEFPNIEMGKYYQDQFDNIFLSEGTQTFTQEVAGLKWDYKHPRDDASPAPTLTDNSPNTQIGWMPFASTMGSVYGVGGEYNGKADIYTKDIAGDETKSIIEIGSETTNQDQFHIYSGGMLKNFRSGCTNFCAPLLLGWEDGKAPNFYITTDEPLYIINDGNGSGEYCCDGKIEFFPSAVTNLNAAVANASGGGDIHIQSQGSVTFMDDHADPPTPVDLNFTLQQDNEVKILSDNNFIHIENTFLFDNADKAHLTLWARGIEIDPINRGYTDLGCNTGAIQIDGEAYAYYTIDGTGLAWFRSEFDDVLFGSNFNFTNYGGTDESGELMVQAGQDIRIEGETSVIQDGQRSILFEAKKTIAFNYHFTAELGKMKNVMENGDLTLKAGYKNFSKDADVTDWEKGDCVNTQEYANREANQPAETTGGDIWFKGDVRLEMTPTKSDDVDVFIRAYNSISKDNGFTLYYEGTNTGSPNTIMTFAETGNIEAITPDGNPDYKVEFFIGADDWVNFLYQAGNKVGNPCGVMDCPIDILQQWSGNILYAKPFTIKHKGRGPTLISASRDIENQLNAPFTFNYDNTALNTGDNLTVTAGRHIETHAPYTFNYGAAGTGISNNITMQAGRLTNDTYVCDENLCKTIEQGTSLAVEHVLTDPSWGAQQDPRQDNFFAAGGLGQGSILAFSTINFDYKGQGTILMTAKNGNIETDPYLHGGTYANHAAQLVFEHEGRGLTSMEAIDIKLHDRMSYFANSTSQTGYGNLQIHAFDSILTRTLEYINPNGDGSVTITTDKYKPNTNCGDYLTADGGGGINQGHIVLGYGADCTNGLNVNDSIVFDFSNNPTTNGANVIIRAGYLGYQQNPLANGYGGNITFDFIYAHMAEGNHKAGGYMEISTPNGNIWGKDSLYLQTKEGDLYVDAGTGSEEDVLRAARWSGFESYNNGNGKDKTLNTEVPNNCPDGSMWRTGNIMMKGAYLNFNNGKGNATFRTREGFIDTYDAFTVEGMEGHLLKYAALNAGISENHYGDISERDFKYTPVANSGSVFFGADDNIMLNYGNNNLRETAYNGRGEYNVNNGLSLSPNPFYSTSYKPVIEDCSSVFDVNTNGYLWYKQNPSSFSPLHTLYRGGNGSPLTGVCATADNKAREMIFHFDRTDGSSTLNVASGGFAAVTNNFIDVFTRFEYFGGVGSGLHSVPEMGQLHGEDVAGFGLFMKSQFQGGPTEYRRASCFGCGVKKAFPIDSRQAEATYEWPYIGFHDDARVHTHNQKSVIDAPIVEFFGHAELDAESEKGPNTDLTLRGDSLIFHDSVIFNGTFLTLLPYTTGAQRINDMRYGVINDDGNSTKYYGLYGPAIAMEDRNTPVIELGYQRCVPPRTRGNLAPNARSLAGFESTPYVGGDIIVCFKHGFTLPIVNSVVANHARISFITDSLDHFQGGEFVDSYIRTDLLRIRNHVEFYTAPGNDAKYRTGNLELVSYDQMPTVDFPGIYPHHLHLEPGSELSLPGDDALIVEPTTTLGGYGNLHQDVLVIEHGTLAPGFASLMETDCQTPDHQGTLTLHNLSIEKDATFRISIGNNNIVQNQDGNDVWATLTDKVVVQDSVELFGRVPVVILPEKDYFAPGVYTILEYGDLTGLSSDYVHNFYLPQTNYFGYNFSLDFAERGKVKLVVALTPTPPIQRFIQIPLVDGVTTIPAAGTHYAPGDSNFTFRAKFESDVLAMKALGYITGEWNDLDAMRMQLSDGWFLYTIPRVLEPYVIYIGPELTSYEYVGNEIVSGLKVWTYKNTLFVNIDADDVVTIYSMTGVLYRKENVKAGQNKITLDAGIYVVTLNNGVRFKVIIK